MKYTAEFDKLLSDLGVDDAKAQEACKLLADKNNDGVVSKQEFYEWIKKDQIQSILHDSDKFTLLCGVADIFKSFDVDGDKTISWPEFKKYMADEGHSTKVASGFWKAIDTDGDGKITFKEFWDHNKNWNGDFDE